MQCCLREERASALKTPYLPEEAGIVVETEETPSGVMQSHFACRNGAVGTTLDNDLGAMSKHIAGSTLDEASTRQLAVDLLWIVYRGTPLSSSADLWQHLTPLSGKKRKELGDRLRPHSKGIRPIEVTVTGPGPWRFQVAALVNTTLMLYMFSVSTQGAVAVTETELLTDLPVPRPL